MMNDLKLVNAVTSSEKLTMSSLEIAELTGKQHCHVLSDIDRMLKELDILAIQFTITRTDHRGKIQRVFNLPKRECLILASGYGIKIIAEIIDRWIQLEEPDQS